MARSKERTKGINLQRLMVEKELYRLPALLLIQLNRQMKLAQMLPPPYGAAPDSRSTKRNQRPTTD